MPANNRIMVELIAQDLISPVINQLQGKFGGFGTLVSGAMGAAFSPDPLVSFTSLALTAVNSLTEAAQTFNRTMKEAAAFEIRSLNASVGLGSAGNLPLERAKALTKELEKQAALAAAALPGETADYVKSGQAINDALAKNFNLNTENGIKDFKAMSDSIVKGVGFVAATATASGSDTVNRAFEGFLNGSRSMSELAMIDDIKASPIYNILDRLTAGQNVKAMSLAQRAEILAKASQQFLSPENIAAYSGTLEGINSSIKSYFFDIQSGVFGFLRSVNAAGGQSVLDAYKQLVQNFVVLGGLVGRIANQAGLSFDPMLSIIQGLNWLSDQAVKLGDFFRAASVGGFDVSEIDFTEGIATVFNTLFDLLHKFMEGVNWSALAFTLGHILVKAAGGIGRYLVSGDLWMRVVRGFLDVIQAMATSIIGALGGVVTGYVSHLSQAFQEWVDRIVEFFGQPAQLVSSIIDNVAGAISAAGQKFSEAFSGIISAIANKIPGLGWLAEKPKQLNQLPDSTAMSGSALPLPMTNTSQSTATNNQVAINIAPQPNASPDSIAQSLMAMMDNGYKNYRSASLTA